MSGSRSPKARPPGRWLLGAALVAAFVAGCVSSPPPTVPPSEPGLSVPSEPTPTTEPTVDSSVDCFGRQMDDAGDEWNPHRVGFVNRAGDLEFCTAEGLEGVKLALNGDMEGRGDSAREVLTLTIAPDVADESNVTAGEERPQISINVSQGKVREPGEAGDLANFPMFPDMEGVAWLSAWTYDWGPTQWEETRSDREPWAVYWEKVHGGEPPFLAYNKGFEGHGDNVYLEMGPVFSTATLNPDGGSVNKSFDYPLQVKFLVAPLVLSDPDTGNAYKDIAFIHLEVLINGVGRPLVWQMTPPSAG